MNQPQSFLSSWIVLKRGLLCFWAMLLSIVVVTNLLDALRALEVLPAAFPFASGNFAAVQAVLKPCDAPREFAAALFVGVIAREALAAALFWRAVVRFRGRQDERSSRILLPPFMVGLGLWGAFQLACELFPSLLAYQIAASHRALFTMQLATLLAVMLLPDDDAPRSAPPSGASEPR